MEIFMAVMFFVTNLFIIMIMRLTMVSSFEYKAGMYLGVHIPAEKKEAAAKFVAYLTLGDGADIFGKQLTGTSAKKDFTVDASLFDTDESKAGWDTVVDLINTATADRNNVSGYSDIEGAAVQSVLNGSATTESVLKDLQKEWTSGKY